MRNWYRYVDFTEESFIRSTNTIRSLTGITYYGCDPPSAYEKATDVHDLLATPGVKQFSIGPIPDDEAPDMDVVPPRTVSPRRLSDGSWAPGGGTEGATSHIYRIFGHIWLK